MPATPWSSLLPLTVEHCTKSGIFVCAKGAHFARWRLDSAIHFGTLIHTETGKQSTWRIEGFVQRDNELYLYGPELQGESLHSILGSPDTKDTKMQKLLTGLCYAEEQLSAMQRIYLPACFLCDTQILILSEALQQQLLHHSLLPARDEAHCFAAPSPYMHRMGYNFFLASLLYQFLCDTAPYPFENTKQWEHTTAKNTFMHLSSLAPSEQFSRAEREIVQKIETALAGSNAPIQLDYTEVQPHLGPLRDALNGHQKTIAAYKANALREFHRRQRQKRLFVPIAIGVTALAVVTYTAVAILQAVFAPSPYAAYSSEAIIRLYFHSINELDLDTISAIAHRRVTRMRRYVMSSLAVLERMSPINQGTEAPISIIDWEAADSPKLFGQLLYGVKPISLEPLELLETQNDTRVYRAVYDEWSSSVTEGDPTLSVTIRQTRVTALLTMTFRRERWIIDEFTIQNTETIK